MSDQLASYIAGEMRAQRGRLKLTYDQLADRAGIPTSRAHRVLSGDVMMDVNVLVALSQALELDPGALVNAAVKYAMDAD